MGLELGTGWSGPAMTQTRTARNADYEPDREESVEPIPNPDPELPHDSRTPRYGSITLPEGLLKRVNSAIVFVSDMQQSVAFYRDVFGLPLGREGCAMCPGA